MSLHVDTLEVKVTGSGLKLNVQSFLLNVAVNAIPEITLECLPVESSPGKIEVSKPTISDLRKLYSELLPKALESKTTASIEIKVSSQDKTSICGQQTVKLEDWVLSDVGLTSVTTTSAPSLRVVFKHPAVRLTRSGEVYEVPYTSPDYDKWLSSITGKTIVKFLDNLYTELTNDKKVKFYPIGKNLFGGSDDFENKVRAFRTSLKDILPSTYLDCSCPIFLQPIVSPYENLRSNAIANLGLPGPGSISLWYIILTKICSQCLMHIRPTYDNKKLTVEPLQPWYSSGAHEISENLIETIELPGNDPDPICGTAVSRELFTGFLAYDSGQKAVRYSGSASYACKHSFFIPEKVQPSATGRWGRIMTIAPNYIISGIASKSDSNDKPQGGGGKTTIQDSQSKGDNNWYVKAEDLYAKAMFECLYRKNCTASISTTLIFKDASGKMLYPGEIAKIKADGNDLFMGYIYRLIVSGSSSGGIQSRMDFSYVRDPNDKELLVPEGTINECYQLSGGK